MFLFAHSPGGLSRQHARIQNVRIAAVVTSLAPSYTKPSAISPFMSIAASLRVVLIQVVAGNDLMLSDWSKGNPTTPKVERFTAEFIRIDFLHERPIRSTSYEHCAI
jgi:hypothetical protein